MICLNFGSDSKCHYRIIYLSKFSSWNRTSFHVLNYEIMEFIYLFLPSSVTTNIVLEVKYLFFFGRGGSVPFVNVHGK